MIRQKRGIIMKKLVTLFTVDHAVFGGNNGTVRAYFRTYDDAKKFAKMDFCDKPVARTYTAENAKKIMDSGLLNEYV